MLYQFVLMPLTKIQSIQNHLLPRCLKQMSPAHLFSNLIMGDLSQQQSTSSLSSQFSICPRQSAVKRQSRLFIQESFHIILQLNHLRSHYPCLNVKQILQNPYLISGSYLLKVAHCTRSGRGFDLSYQQKFQQDMNFWCKSYQKM